MKCVHLLPPLMVLLGGCAAVADNFRSPAIPGHPWVGRSPCDGARCTRKEALEAVARAQNYCSELREFQERGGQITGGQRLFVGLLGTLAGSVFSVTAGGTAAKAWSGLSGATNGIQLQIDQAAGKPGGPAVIEEIAKAQAEGAQEIKRLMAEAIRNDVWEPLVMSAVLLPDSCSAAAGRGFARQQAEEASAAQRSAVVDAAASAASAATSALLQAAAAASAASR